MSIRSALLLAAAAAASAAALPSAAGAQILAAPPAYAQPGACYAHVRRAPRYAPPPGPVGAWRLTPARPGEPGPTWCFVTEPGGPPVLLDAGVDGWIRVACPHPVLHRTAPRPRPAPHRRPRPHVHHHVCGCRPAAAASPSHARPRAARTGPLLRRSAPAALLPAADHAAPASGGGDPPLQPGRALRRGPARPHLGRQGRLIRSSRRGRRSRPVTKA